MGETVQSGDGLKIVYQMSSAGNHRSSAVVIRNFKRRLNTVATQCVPTILLQSILLCLHEEQLHCIATCWVAVYRHAKL